MALRNNFNKLAPRPDGRIPMAKIWVAGDTPALETLARSTVVPPVYFTAFSAPDMDTARAQELGRKLGDALLIASQSETGRGILREAADAGYRLMIDPAGCARFHAYGFCEPVNKWICLKIEGQSSERIALTLVHEAMHAVQMSVLGLDFDLSYTPHAMLRTLLVMEADARAKELTAGLELAMANADNKWQQKASQEEPVFCLPGMVKLLKDKFDDIPHAEKIIARALEKPEIITSGQAAAALFLAAFGSVHFRAVHETLFINLLEGAGSKRLGDPALLRREVSSQELLDGLVLNGIPYARKHLGAPDFSAAQFSGIGQETHRKIQSLYERRQALAPTATDPLPWHQAFEIYRVKGKVPEKVTRLKAKTVVIIR